MTDSKHTEQDLIHQGNQQPLAKLQIADAMMFPLFGALSAYQVNQASSTRQALQTELQQVRQETERKQKFVERIQSQLENLTGENPAKAKIALASLHALAKEEDDKSILFTIAITSDNAAMKNTMSDLVQEDTTSSSGLKKKIKAKLRNILTASIPETGGRQTVKTATSINLWSNAPTAGGPGCINGVLAMSTIISNNAMHQNRPATFS